MRKTNNDELLDWFNEGRVLLGRFLDEIEPDLSDYVTSHKLKKWPDLERAVDHFIPWLEELVGSNETDYGKQGVVAAFGDEDAFGIGEKLMQLVIQRWPDPTALRTTKRKSR
jgi:hypothetical protein